MGRIAKTEDNIVSIPKSVSVTAKGYVYWNATTTWGDKANGTGKRADHKKECIGVILCPGSDWKKDRRMYANPTYYQIFPSNKGSSQNTQDDKAATARKEYPQRFDCISVGLYAVVDKLAEESGLYDVLLDVFEQLVRLDPGPGAGGGGKRDTKHDQQRERQYIDQHGAG